MFNGIAYLQGHVEILHNGVWGTICDDGFSKVNADVLCRMAGYVDGEYASKYKQPSATKASKIWLDDVVCNGSESDIGDCAHNTWGSHNCNHTKDVGLRCTGKITGPGIIFGHIQFALITFKRYRK